MFHVGDTVEPISSFFTSPYPALLCRGGFTKPVPQYLFHVRYVVSSQLCLLAFLTPSEIDKDSWQGEQYGVSWQR